MPRRAIHTWAVACPECPAQVDQPCYDLRYRRRVEGGTHKARVRKAREMPYATITAPVLPDTVWHGWVTATTAATATVTQTVVWDNWVASMNTVGTSAATTATGLQALRAPVQRTARELRHWQETEAQRRREIIAAEERNIMLRRAARHKQDAAQERAMCLLRSVVPSEEFNEDMGTIKVKGRLTGTVYVIRMNGIHGNILELDEHGCYTHSWCGAPRQRVPGWEELPPGEPIVIPDADAWLGQYLALKYNEGAYRQKANRTIYAGCSRGAYRTTIAA